MLHARGIALGDLLRHHGVPDRLGEVFRVHVDVLRERNTRHLGDLLESGNVTRTPIAGKESDQLRHGGMGPMDGGEGIKGLLSALPLQEILYPGKLHRAREARKYGGKGAAP